MTMLKSLPRGLPALWAAMAVACASPAPCSDEPPRVAAASPSLLAEHCLECHGPDDAQASFRVDTLPFLHARCGDSQCAPLAW